MVAVAYRKLRKRYNLQEGNIIPVYAEKLMCCDKAAWLRENRSFGQAMHVIRGTPIEQNSRADLGSTGLIGVVLLASWGQAVILLLAIILLGIVGKITWWLLLRVLLALRLLHGEALFPILEKRSQCGYRHYHPGHLNPLCQRRDWLV